MHQRTTFAGLGALLTAGLLAVGCHDPQSPARRSRISPEVAAAAQGIALDQKNGSFTESGTLLAKGFNPTNPHLGDAIIATFFWLGSSNIITSVTDRLPNGTPVGNTYTPVEFVTADGISMATYVATNVQNFPDPNPDQNTVLVVQASLSSSVTDGGVLLSAYTGVGAAFPQALGAHQSASGSGTSNTVADPGAIAISAGALAYGVTMSNDATVAVSTPAGFTPLLTQSNTFIKGDGEFAVPTAAGSIDPQWTWFFNSPGSPRTWLATVLSLLPPPATHLVFAVQPSNTTARSAISPPVQVAAQDDAGNTVASFTGSITVALGTNPSGGTLTGTTMVTAVNGVATFSDLSIDQAGNGYTLVAVASGLTAATSAAFNITPRSATHLVFTGQPSNTTAGRVISPPVQVAAQDDAGNIVVTFAGSITVALGTNPSGGTLSGAKIVTPVNGVATFPDLSIDRAGNGYTLVATALGLVGATSVAFNITPPPRANGGGRIDPAIGKTTFGFDVDGRSGPPFKGEMEVVTHGGASRMTRIRSLVIDGVGSSRDPRGGLCVTWNGMARVNNRDQRRYTATACDNGEPGSTRGQGPDRFGVTVDGSVSTGLTDLSGGNIRARE